MRSKSSPSRDATTEDMLRTFFDSYGKTIDMLSSYWDESIFDLATTVSLFARINQKEVDTIVGETWGAIGYASIDGIDLAVLSVAYLMQQKNIILEEGTLMFAPKMSNSTIFPRNLKYSEREKLRRELRGDELWKLFVDWKKGLEKKEESKGVNQRDPLQLNLLRM